MNQDYVRGLRVRQAQARARLELLDERVRDAGRAMTEAERDTWEQLDAELVALRMSIRVAEEQHAAETTPGDYARDLLVCRYELAERCSAVVAEAAGAGRTLTADEVGAWEADRAELLRVTAEIDRLEHEARLAAAGAFGGV